MNQIDFYNKREAIIFGRYLLKKNPDENAIGLYVSAMNVLQINLSEKEKRILKYIHKNAWSVPLIDAGLIIMNPKSHIRKKIFSMLAILESSPKYSGFFLSKNFSVFYPLYILLTLFKSVVKTGIGAILIAIL